MYVCVCVCVCVRAHACTCTCTVFVMDGAFSDDMSLLFFPEPSQSCPEVSVRVAAFSASLQLSQQHPHCPRAKDEFKSIGRRGIHYHFFIHLVGSVGTFSVLSGIKAVL